MPLTRSERNYLLAGIAIGFAVASNWSTLKKRFGPYLGLVWAKLSAIFGMASEDVAHYFKSVDEAVAAQRTRRPAAKRRAKKKSDAGLDPDTAKIIEGLFDSAPRSRARRAKRKKAATSPKRKKATTSPRRTSTAARKAAR